MEPSSWLGVLLVYGVGQRLQLSKRMDRISKTRPKFTGLAILAKNEVIVLKPEHKRVDRKSQSN